jgi:hypothetical protein
VEWTGCGRAYARQLYLSSMPECLARSAIRLRKTGSNDSPALDGCDVGDELLSRAVLVREEVQRFPVTGFALKQDAELGITAVAENHAGQVAGCYARGATFVYPSTIRIPTAGN